jgi:hypothetical protein
VNSALFYREKPRSKEGKPLTRYLPFFNVGMLLGQSKVARADEGRFKPIHCLHQNVIHGAMNPLRADARFKFYNKEALQKCSKLYNGEQLNWYLPRTMGGLGMKPPIGSTFVSESDIVKGKRVSYPIVITDRQRMLAHSLREKWYADDIIKPPFKPIGLPVDDDLQTWGCDIKKRYVLRAQLSMCPLLPDAEEVPVMRHDANWYMPYTGDIEGQILKFQFQGLDWRRTLGRYVPTTWDYVKKARIYSGADVNTSGEGRLKRTWYGDGIFVSQGNPYRMKMLEMDNAHMYDEIVLKKRRVDRSLIRDLNPTVAAVHLGECFDACAELLLTLG